MADNTRILQIMNGHFKHATAEPDEYLIYARNPDNISEMWVLIRNMKGRRDEWTNGYFLFKLVVPSTFPNDPPSFYAQNENGAYEVNRKCCISIGEFHKSSYRAVLGIRGFATELANGMMNWEYMTELGGIGLLKNDFKVKSQISEQSLVTLYKNFAPQMELLEEAYANYTKRWNLSKCNNEMRKNLAFGKTTFPLLEESGSQPSSAP